MTDKVTGLLVVEILPEEAYEGANSIDDYIDEDDLKRA